MEKPMKASGVPAKEQDIQTRWESELKPKVLERRSVPLSLVGEVLGCSVQKVQEMLRSGMYSFGTARKGENPNSKYAFDVYPLRFVAWYEGRMR